LPFIGAARCAVLAKTVCYVLYWNPPIKVVQVKIMKTIHAIYEEGVFKPTEPVDLPEHCRVTVAPAIDTPSIEDVLTELAKEAPEEEWAKLPQDLTDKLDDYLYGAGR
jgi:predicted DNA-binding antitoxin AbrB/MazE fold protein